MKTRRPITRNTETAAFLGIGEGRRKRAKAEAAALLLKTKEEEARKTAAAAAALEANGYKTVEKLKAETADKVGTATATAEAATADSSKTLYYIIAAIVVAVMIGLYFITKKR